MPRDGAITFRDIGGKLTVLRIECDKCGRFGQYHLDRLIDHYGIATKLFSRTDEITADSSVFRCVVRSKHTSRRRRFVGASAAQRVAAGVPHTLLGVWH
jgi:hypothetical protein